MSAVRIDKNFQQDLSCWKFGRNGDTELFKKSSNINALSAVDKLK